MKNSSKKLFWISYNTSGLFFVGGPNVSPLFLESAGLETEIRFWMPEPTEDISYSRFVANEIFTGIEKWVPNIIAIAYDGNGATEDITDEPPILIDLCERIRNSAVLKGTKIIAFFRMQRILEEKEVEWRKRYDFYSLFPIKVIEHTKILKQLVGEELDNSDNIVEYFSEKTRRHDSKYIIL